MSGVPPFVSILFMLTVFVTVGISIFVVRRDSADTTAGRVVLAAIPFWLLFQAALGIGGFYQHTEGVPPRLLLFGPLPAFLFILALFVFARRTFVASLPLLALTLIHTIRIPIEIVLHFLEEAGAIAPQMSFTGWNFDILSGITAPLVAYLAFRGKYPNRTLLIGWNLAALGLVLTIVGISIAAFPSPMQQIAFEQPNRAVSFFPYVWLPSVIVPIVVFCHFASLYKLFANKI
ncbi:MAG: hypothetical protein IPM21_16545 [Acidobacteria bacterium]|nr:hypothetical protein [Acidobacteriota bacterium]